jgi:hypothetical protein
VLINQQKKSKHNNNNNNKMQDSATTATTTPAKRAAERMREYRGRKKQALLDDSVTTATKTTTKSASERMREYRARKQTLLANVAQSHAEELQNLHAPCAASIPLYSDYRRHKTAHSTFKTKFKDNTFGHACSVCDRLWFKDDLNNPTAQNEPILRTFLPNVHMGNILICSTCKLTLHKQNIPAMSTYNGFKYPEIPAHLPPLDLVSERLISPRIPFMHIRRLRHVNGQYGIYGHIINVPVSLNTMVNRLPRDIDDDHCINVHIKRKKFTNLVTYTAWLTNVR